MVFPFLVLRYSTHLLSWRTGCRAFFCTVHKFIPFAFIWLIVFLYRQLKNDGTKVRLKPLVLFSAATTEIFPDKLNKRFIVGDHVPPRHSPAQQQRHVSAAPSCPRPNIPTLNQSSPAGLCTSITSTQAPQLPTPRLNQSLCFKFPMAADPDSSHSLNKRACTDHFASQYANR